MNIWHHLPDLYFLHIPKTAGTSVRSWLEQLYPADAILPAHHLKQMEDAPDEDIRGCKLARGHFGWRYVDRAQALGKNPEVVTFLRDTVSLRMSSISYAPSVPEAVFAELAPEVAARMRATVESSMDAQKLDHITRQEFDPDEAIANLTPEHKIGQDIQARFLSLAGSEAPNLSQLTDQEIAAAHRHLAQISGVGVVEDIAGSAAVICDRLGLPYLPVTARRNVSANKIQPTESYKKFTRLQNAHDGALHRRATEMVADRLEEIRLRYGFHADASVEDLAGAMRESFIRTNRDVERIRNANIAMSDGFVSEGFRDRVHHEPIDRFVRWAGKRSTIFLPLAAGADLKIRIDIAACMTAEIRSGIRLSVNGYDVPLDAFWEVWGDEKMHPIKSGVIPASAIDPDAQYTSLEFNAPDEIPPGDPRNSTEGGAAFALAGIKIERWGRAGGSSRQQV